MLDADTKRIINNARDILVGKVPNPQSQVDLITIAMIYKFMDDMDLQNYEDHGKRIYFVDDIEPYAFSKIMDQKLGNQARLNLYAEALDKLPFAKSVPELFRTIFRGAFLPFRDPATLTMFLKEINNFTYDNSETLGNAFEYLLSIMGSQGDAGQFRTPRHIIDFIVNVVKPAKTDTILDPACGTAGFLISAYLYIKRHNKDMSVKEMQALTDNIVGYDISPDMRKLALVNLYLHRFTEPKVYEYDTLTQEERWGDKFDVVLANPPFMTPKGGIQPHNRFSVRANRSEVLFVDYIAEHLTLNGRAGIIVPEGIIFQSATAYKALRRMLVEDNYLYAVVSLPAGVFNPYSGVKTSILLFDRAIAKQKKDILFVQVNYDGFTLSTQRRASAANDLPEALEIIEKWKASNDISAYSRALLVSKKKIAEGGEYNLNGPRYVSEKETQDCKYDFVKLEDICEIYQPKTITQSDLIEDGEFDVWGANGIIGKYSQFNHEDSEVAITCRGATCGTVNFTTPKSWITGNAMVVKPKGPDILKEYLFWILKSKDLTSVISGSAQPQITRAALAPFPIPLPPLDVQKQIVEEIENKQSIINNTHKTLKNLERERFYFARLLDGIDFGSVELSNIARIDWGNTSLTKESYIEGGEFIGVSAAGCDGRMGHFEHDVGTTVLSAIGANCGKIFYPTEKFTAIKNTITFSPDISMVKPLYLYFAMQENSLPRRGGGQPFISKGDVEKYKIPVPSLANQERIVATLDAEQKATEAARQLIDLMREKIDNVIKRIYKCEE